MYKSLLPIAFAVASLVLAPCLVSCTAASAPGQGGISIPNLITAPATAPAGSTETSPDYLFVDALDPDVPGTSQTDSPRVILAAGNNRGSVRLASTGELLAAVPYPATRYTLLDLNNDNVRDLLVLNGQAGPGEPGLRAFDMKKLLEQKELVGLGLSFNGPVYAAAEYGASSLLLALGTQVVAVSKSNLQVATTFSSLPAKDVFRLNTKPTALNASTRVLQFGFHTTNDCGDYKYCLEIYSAHMVLQDRLSTNAEPGKHLSLFTDDLGEDGTIDSLYTSEGDRTTEIQYLTNSLTVSLKDLKVPNGGPQIPSVAVSTKDMWNRAGRPRDLLVTVPAEGGGATATVCKEKITGSTPTSSFDPDTVLNWTLPRLRSALVKKVFQDDDILLMESDAIHVLEGEVNPDGNLEFFDRYSIAD